MTKHALNWKEGQTYTPNMQDLFKETFSSAEQLSERIMAFAEGVAIDISIDSHTTNTKLLYTYWGDKRMDCNAIHPQLSVRPTARTTRRLWSQTGL